MPPHHQENKYFQRKGGRKGKQTSSSSICLPPLLPRLCPVLPSCPHGSEVGPARWPRSACGAARAAAGAGGGGAWGQAGEGRGGVELDRRGGDGGVLRRLPALRRRLPARVRSPLLLLRGQLMCFRPFPFADSHSHDEPIN